MEFFERHGVITQYQNAYLRNRNTERGVYQMFEEVIKNLNNKKRVAGVYLDLSKAFDSVNIQLLLSKLGNYGIRGKALTLMESSY